MPEGHQGVEVTMVVEAAAAAAVVAVHQGDLAGSTSK